MLDAGQLAHPSVAALTGLPAERIGQLSGIGNWDE